MRIHYFIPALLFVAFGFLTACKEDTNHLFTTLDEDRTGITFKNQLFDTEQFNVLNYSYFYNGGGVAIGDVNGDGLQDVLFTGNMVRNRLFLNKGDFKFEDITDKSGVADQQGWCTGATIVDINADGKMDIYICRSADINPARRKNLLFINNGDLTFTEKAEAYGLADEGYSTQASFFDYDKDGDLDMFLINHSLQKYTTGGQEHPELRTVTNPDFANKLYRNDNSRFTNVSDSAGITSNVLTFGLGVAISDVNSDGWPDVYVSNDFNEPDYLFINNANGTFTERLKDCMDQVSLYSMGSDLADYNNDGLPDLVTLDMLPEENITQKMHSGAENFDKFQMLFKQNFYYQYSRNMLHKNNGDGTFSEIGQLAGISNTDWSWSALLSDFDNDGNKDLFVSNGYVKDYTDMDFVKYTVDRVVRAREGGENESMQAYLNSMPSIEMSNYIFQNQGDGRFVKKTNEWGLSQKGVSAGAAYADLDNDGDLDLVINNTNSFASILKNNRELQQDNHFLRLKLVGDPRNITGIGTRVVVYCKNSHYTQEQMPVRGFQSSVDPVLTVGLGANTVVDSVVVGWPDQYVQVLRNVPANQTLLVKRSEASVIDRSFPKQRVTPLFDTALALGFVHKENEYNDFTRQPLLPNFLSRPGPCLAKADVNKDGREDIFIGGAKGQPGKLLLQNAAGLFIANIQPAVAKDSASEDTAAVFIDADGDGDQDLYVGSGGYEFPLNDPALQDRLYMNDGVGHFARAETSLPGFTGATGCVRAADIDGDGDLDLFVGSRLVPGNYPLTPESQLLVNNGKGNFTDGTLQRAPSLRKVGMVTDAAWVDVDNDRLPDLIVVGEWMPVKIYLNKKGSLVDASDRYIKFASGGWWNGLLADDFDGDGDQDLVLGNLGLNAQFKASDKEPLSMYYKDFDGNGSLDPIFCYYVNGVSYPAASRDDLMDQLPGLKKKFLEYKTYATATITDVFTPEQLKDAGKLEAHLLATVYLQNDGANGFVKKDLPLEAQYAPVYAMASFDANGDGKKDLMLAGNNSWTRIKFGRYNANHGCLLIGDGKGNFKYVPQYASGLNVRADVRSLLAVSTGGFTDLIFGVNNGPANLVRSPGSQPLFTR